MIELITWVAATGSNIEVRSERRRLFIYADVAASRRLVLGVDKSGLPVFGIPIVDKVVFSQFNWTGVVFASNVVKNPDLKMADAPYLGLLGTDYNKDQCSIWLPIQDGKLFAALLAAAKKFHARPGLIRMVCYHLQDNKPTWLPDEDLAICDLFSINGQPISAETLFALKPTQAGPAAELPITPAPRQAAATKPAAPKSPPKPAKPAGKPFKRSGKSKFRGRSGGKKPSDDDSFF